jgi:hypothetical protein
MTKPSSYLQQERQTLLLSFADVLPTMEHERVEIEEVTPLPLPIYTEAVLLPFE